jgi:hypothetical protein
MRSEQNPVQRVNAMSFRRRRRSGPAAPWVFLLMGLFSGSAGAATLEIFPATADCTEEFEDVANTLKPGDELVLHAGTYSQTCRRAITVVGTATQPIVIRAAAAGTVIVTRPEGQMDLHNNIEIVNSSHLIIRGLRFRGGNIGVRFIGGHHITLEDSEIYETGNNAIAMNSGDTDAFVIRRNHIHHTGLSTAGLTEGEGLYVGCNDATCRATNSVIEGNYIHHLRATSDGGNDGIEVKVGSHGNLIRNNVIHDTNIGTEYPCIFVYGGGSAVNIVEGNALWNCGEAIQVASDAIIRNNLILNSSLTGITAAPHSQVGGLRNVTIVNNTIYGHPTCLYIRWSGATNMVLANNAVYCPGATAVDSAGLSGPSVTVHANHALGSLSGDARLGSGFVSGGTVPSAFVDAPQLDFWPAIGSPLIGTAAPAWAPALDFNERVRAAPADVGAYETDGLTGNPGWRVTAGFKRPPGEVPRGPSDLRVR